MYVSLQIKQSDLYDFIDLPRSSDGPFMELLYKIAVFIRKSCVSCCISSGGASVGNY